MIEDLDRTATPLPSRLVEGPDQFTALGVHADHRQILLEMFSDLLPDVAELLIPECGVGRVPQSRLETLDVHPEREPHLLE